MSVPRGVRRGWTVARRAATTSARWIKNQEAAVLAAALAVVIALLALAKTTEEVLEGDRDLDEWLLRLLRRPDDLHAPIGPFWVLQVAQDITALGGPAVLVLVILATLGYLALGRKRGALGLMAIAAGGGGLLSTIMKEIFQRGRPDVVPHLAVVDSPSFPSGHSMLSAVVYLTLGTLLARFADRRRIRVYFIAIAMIVTFLVGCSRVYLGVHYPTDVLAGWCAGLVWALGCWLVARYLQSRGTVSGPS